jgi:hypothetical protein
MQQKWFDQTINRHVNRDYRSKTEITLLEKQNNRLFPRKASTNERSLRHYRVLKGKIEYLNTPFALQKQLHHFY